jgi:hypothetical protein
MDTVPGMIAIFFALLLAALVGALILRRDFRDAVLGGPGEATILRFLTVKGAAIVLLCGLFIGGILFALTILPQPSPNQQAGAHTGPITMRLNIHFDPNDVNPRNPQFAPEAFIKTPAGEQSIPIVYKVLEGALSVQVKVPDMDTPFFIRFETPKGTWKTDDHSIQEAPATARKVELQTGP